MPVEIRPGDRIVYHNHYGQTMNGIVQWVSEKDCHILRVKRADWPRDEAINLADYVSWAHFPAGEIWVLGPDQFREVFGFDR